MQWERRWSCVIAVALAGCGGGAPGAGESDSDGGLADELELPGFVIDGAAAGDRALAVPCGDINGDGLEDLAVGTSRAGQLVAYVVYGKEDDEPVELAEIEAGGAGGVVLDGGATMSSGHHEVFLEVVGVGDVNGDGFDDLSVAPRHVYAGDATLLMGGPDLPTHVDLAALEEGDGAMRFDIAADGFGGDGVEAARVGDVNGDGFDDVALVGVGGFVDRFYVVFGGPAIAGRTEAELNAGVGGFEVHAFASAQVFGPADINGDGVADLVVADRGGYSQAAEVYVLFGGSEVGGESPIQLSDEPPLSVPGFMVVQTEYYAAQFLGGAASGDINGDGLDDIAIDDGGEDAVFVVFGKTDSESVLLPHELGDRGFRIEYGDLPGGGTSYEYRRRLSMIPDHNGDGRDEIVLQSLSAQGEPSQAYVIYGRSETAPVALGDVAAGVGGYLVNDWPEGGYLGDLIGWSAVGGGAARDLVLVDRDASPSGEASGRAYVLFDVPGR
ncbi:MAG: VCBS repeat-containing protein [Myxococcales bacterium]|nr:VCBS repeat-containing protein [Myxococcales bacterium]